MKVKHILISKDAKYYSGKLKGTGLNPNAEAEFKDEVECHAGKGIVGDRFYQLKEDFKGQITFISYELHEKMQEELAQEISLKDYRRNVFVTNLNPLELVGKKFKIGEVEFEGTEDCSPCKFMEQFTAKGALQWMKDNQSGGLRAKILSDGILRIGDELNEF